MIGDDFKNRFAPRLIAAGRRRKRRLPQVQIAGYYVPFDVVIGRLASLQTTVAQVLIGAAVRQLSVRRCSVAHGCCLGCRGRWKNEIHNFIIFLPSSNSRHWSDNNELPHLAHKLLFTKKNFQIYNFFFFFLLCQLIQVSTLRRIFCKLDLTQAVT